MQGVDLIRGNKHFAPTSKDLVSDVHAANTCSGFVGLVGCAAPNRACARATKALIVADTGASVRLCARIRQELRTGPPGFGETPKLDAKRSALVVRLKQPATFRHKTDAGTTVDAKASKVQISVASSDSRLALRRMTGRLVMVEGPVWTASSEGDVTPVAMQMASVSKRDRLTTCDH